MNMYYIFSGGKILLKEETERLPDANSDPLLERLFINRGYLDKENPEGGIWAELDPETVLPEGYRLHERRSLWPLLEESEFFRAGKAFHLMDWQRTHKFCGLCGSRMIFEGAEGAMRCSKCAELEFPVICPAIIVAVERDGKLLMGHGANFPPGRFSVLAGFVEPGESLEDCVRREVYEESKIRIKNIKYFGSQPWPFPRSLMLGFTAEWESGEIEVDNVEVTEAHWFAPGEMPEVFKGISISWRLIDDFIKRHS